MSRQEFHTANVLSVLVENHPHTWAVNRLPNPSIAEWITNANLDLAESTWGLAVETGARAGTLSMHTRPVPVEIGRNYVRYLHNVTAANRGFRVRLRWYDAAGRVVWADPWTAYGASTGISGSPVTAMSDWVHAVSVEIEIAGPDGAYPATSAPGGTVVFSQPTLWFGAAGDTGAMLAGSPASSESPQWTDIHPAASSTEIDREILGVEALRLVIPDASYVPMGDTPLLKPERRVRVMNWMTGERLFTGRISSVDVTHRPREKNPAHRAVVTVHAEGASPALARETVEQSSGRLWSASQTFTGLGVPWVVGGDTVTSSDWPYQTRSASVIDHLVVTRDTACAHAWTDRNGVMQVWGATQVPGVDGAYAPGDFTRTRTASDWTGVTNHSSANYSPWGYAYFIATNAPGLSEAIGPGGLDGIEVTPGETLYLDARVAFSTARSARMGVRWYDINGVVISTAAADLGPVAGGWAFSDISVQSTAPAGAAYAAPILGFYTSTATDGKYMYVQRLSISSSKQAPTRTLGITDADISDKVETTPRRWNETTIELQRGATTNAYGPFVSWPDQQRRGRKPIRLRVAPHTLLVDEVWAERFARIFMGRGPAPGISSELTQITLPVRTLADAGARADRDLYDVLVVMEDSRIGRYRIEGIRHRITASPAVWTVTYDLADASAPATPTTSS